MAAALKPWWRISMPPNDIVDDIDTIDDKGCNAMNGNNGEMNGGKDQEEEEKEEEDLVFTNCTFREEDEEDGEELNSPQITPYLPHTEALTLTEYTNYYNYETTCSELDNGHGQPSYSTSSFPSSTSTSSYQREESNESNASTSEFDKLCSALNSAIDLYSCSSSSSSRPMEQYNGNIGDQDREKSRRTDREEIRRKLAMGGDEDYYGGERTFKKPNLQTRLQHAMNLQICFMNPDTPATPAAAAASAQGVEGSLDGKPASTEIICQGNQPEKKVKAEEMEDEDFFAKQQRLQAEATMALAQVRPMAHMQLEIEKQNRKKSPIAEIIQTAIPGFSDGRKKKLALKVLTDMNVAQLQVVVNDLHTQIESLNEELVLMLVERDDLHMQQDSMLVNSEDLLARAQEFSIKVQTPKKKKDKKK